MNNEYLEDGYLTNKQRKYLENKHHYVEIPISSLTRREENQMTMDSFPADIVEKLEQSENRLSEQYSGQLKEAIKQLTIRQQAIVLLYLDGWKLTSIANQLNITQGAVSKTLYGNHIYKDGEVKIWGGVVKSLRKKMVKP